MFYNCHVAFENKLYIHDLVGRGLGAVPYSAIVETSTLASKQCKIDASFLLGTNGMLTRGFRFSVFT